MFHQGGGIKDDKWTEMKSVVTHGLKQAISGNNLISTLIFDSHW